jgi:hypothetical protein
MRQKYRKVKVWQGGPRYEHTAGVKKQNSYSFQIIYVFCRFSSFSSQKSPKLPEIYNHEKQGQTVSEAIPDLMLALR